MKEVPQTCLATTGFEIRRIWLSRSCRYFSVEYESYYKNYPHPAIPNRLRSVLGEVTLLAARNASVALTEPLQSQRRDRCTLTTLWMLLKHNVVTVAQSQRHNVVNVAQSQRCECCTSRGESSTVTTLWQLHSHNVTTLWMLHSHNVVNVAQAQRCDCCTVTTLWLLQSHNVVTVAQSQRFYCCSEVHVAHATGVGPCT